MTTTQLNSAPSTGEIESGKIQFNQRQADRSRHFIPIQDKIGPIKSALDVRDVLRAEGIVVPAKDGKKFPSPLRPDRNPSCAIWKGKLRDWSTGETLDAIDLYAALHNCSTAQAVYALYARLCGGVVEQDSRARRICRINRDNPDAKAAEQWEAENKKRRQDSWGRNLKPMTPINRRRLSAERDISEDAINRASEQGNLLALPFPYCEWITHGTEGPDAWVITNVERDNAQARLHGGDLWPAPINAKAKTLPGSYASHPIIGDLKDHHAIPFVEGGPDFFAAWHFAFQAGVEDLICPVAMLGASGVIPAESLAQLAGRRVRIFTHDDDAGRKAAKRWAAQLQSVKCFVDSFDFSGLTQADGSAVKDLNDLCRIAPACLDANPGLMDSLFSFATEGR